jgi:hypothetical protein
MFDEKTTSTKKSQRHLQNPKAHMNKMPDMPK